MGPREQLEEIVRGPYLSAIDAERAARAAAVLAAYLRADEEAERLLRAVHEHSIDDEHDDFSALTLHEAAEQVLADADVPLHVRELGAHIKARGWRHRRPVSRPDQINFQLAALLPRHPDIFERVAPNTFGLVRWRSERPRTDRPKPRTALFRGDGTVTGAMIGDRPDDSARSEWRSS